MAKNDIGEVAGNADVVRQFFLKIGQAVTDAGGDMSHMRFVLDTSAEGKSKANRLAAQIAAILVGIITTVSAIFDVLVDYTTPAFETLQAWFVGYIDPAYRDIVFEPIPACKDVSRVNGKIEAVLVHLGRNVSNESVLAELDRLGYRPALYEELVAFSRTNPAMGLEYPVVALGSVALLHGDRCVAYLFQCGGKRALGLPWFGSGWGGSCRFLAVRK